jgi:hypothetical protein
MRENLQGTVVEPFTATIDAERVRYFLEATGETDPIFFDPEHAGAAELLGVPAPPTFLFGPPNYENPLEIMGATYERLLLASAEYEILRLPLVGEDLTCSAHVSEVRTKDTAAGTSTFATFEATYIDRYGHPVIVERATFVERP